MLKFSLFWIRAAWLIWRYGPAFARQIGRTDCGAACVVTLMRMRRLRVDPAQVIEQLDGQRTGSDLASMRVFLKEHTAGRVRALRLAADQLAAVKLPAIIHLRQLHYCVVLHIGVPGVLCFDPGVGLVFYDHASFRKYFSGHVLELSGGTSSARAPREKGAASRASLVFLGLAGRILECAILAGVAGIMFLLLNQGSRESVVISAVGIAVSGLMLLGVRRAIGQFETGYARLRQSVEMRRMLRLIARGRDVGGFRGRKERDVARVLRQALQAPLQKQTKRYASMGALAVLPVLLWFLSPWATICVLGLILGAILLAPFSDVVMCKQSTDTRAGRYVRWADTGLWVNPRLVREVFAEASRWAIIFLASYGVLAGNLAPQALVFWVLLSIWLLPGDMRRLFDVADPAMRLATIPAFWGEAVARRAISPSTDMPVLRTQGIEEGFKVGGLLPLTAPMRQPDLTVREQRALVCAVVQQVAEQNTDAGCLAQFRMRVFSPGQEATVADVLQMQAGLPTQRAAQANINAAVSYHEAPDGRMAQKDAATLGQDMVVRALSSCEAMDLPVFWDVRSRLAAKDIQRHMQGGRVRHAVILSMSELTVVTREA